MTEQTPTVEFYFDPSCPWCWMTSRWVHEVSAVRNFPVLWRPISLAILNEGNEALHSSPEAAPYIEGHRRGKRFGQIAIAIGETAGDEAVGKFYTEVGTRIHPGARTDDDAIALEALAAVGLPAELADRADVSDDATLRANTDYAMATAGPDVGVPIISVDGNAFFGPVMTPAPTGDDALRLWDGMVMMASVPGFYELKRGRTAGPQF